MCSCRACVCAYQIVVADVWAACGCQRLPGPPAEGATVAPLGAFYDIDALTMFGTRPSVWQYRLCHRPSRASAADLLPTCWFPFPFLVVMLPLS